MNMRGVTVYVVRVVTSSVLKLPAGSVIQLNETPGSIDSLGVTFRRARPMPRVDFSPP